MDAIKSSSVGMKDSGTTLQTCWNDIFIPVSAKVRRKTQGIDDGRYVNRLVDSVSSCGEYDRLVQGLFEHYPNLKPLDASLGNVCRTLDWLAYYDRMYGKINENQEFELFGYIPYAIVPWHSHLAAPANSTKPTEWPKADYEVSLAGRTDLIVGVSDETRERGDRHFIQASQSADVAILVSHQRSADGTGTSADAHYYPNITPSRS